MGCIPVPSALSQGNRGRRRRRAASLGENLAIKPKWLGIQGPTYSWWVNMPLVQTVTYTFQVCITYTGVVAVVGLHPDLILAARLGSPLWFCWTDLWFWISYSMGQVFWWMSGLLLSAVPLSTTIPFLLISMWSASCGDGELDQPAWARGSSTLGVTGPETPLGHLVSVLCFWDPGKTAPIVSLSQPSIPNSFAQVSSGWERQIPKRKKRSRYICLGYCPGNSSLPPEEICQMI